MKKKRGSIEREITTSPSENGVNPSTPRECPTDEHVVGEEKSVVLRKKTARMSCGGGRKQAKVVVVEV